MEIYISTDVEADGPIPGPNSMLSLGSAAYLSSGEMVSTYGANLEPLVGSKMDPDTKKFWDKNPEAYTAATINPRMPEAVMKEYNTWVRHLSEKNKALPVFVGFPASYDFMFVYWYLIKFAGTSPFSFSALDMKTMGMFLMDCGYRHATKKNMPRHWFAGKKKGGHTHRAVDDAIEQGDMFIRMLKDYKAFISALQNQSSLI